MPRIRVLDPTAAPPQDQSGPGPDVGDLAGKIVGFRSDRTWRSFEWVIDEWARRLNEHGVETVTWIAGNRIGEEGETTARQLDQFADRVDVAFVGLGN
jgi:hypothetical protein